MKSSEYRQLKLLIAEAIKEAGISSKAMYVMPGTPEWEELQKSLERANTPKPSFPPRSDKPAFVAKAPEPEVERPVKTSKQNAMILTPEESEILRKAAEIMHRKKM